MIWSSTSFQSSSPAYITRAGSTGTFTSYEVWITLAHQHAQDVGMGVGEMLGPHDVRMRIDPGRRACRHSARSDRRSARGRSDNPAERYDALGRVAVDGGAPPWQERSAARPTMPASVWSVAPSSGSGTSIVSSGPSAGGARKARSSAPVGGLVATLPLWHVEPQRCGSHVLHMRSVVALKKEGSAI